MKKIILLLLFLISFANADYVLYVNSPEEVDSMYAILNAIAKIFGSDDYLGLLKLMFLFGGFVAFFSWVIGTFNHGEAHSGGSNFTKFHIGAVTILTLVFSVQTTVWVKSENFPQYYENSSTTTGVAVDNIPEVNIPEVVGYSMYFLNKFGRGLENMYEIAMTPVGSYSLKDGGYASSLRDDFQLLSMKLGDTDGTLGQAVDTVISQCIFIPFSAKGAEGADRIEELKTSSNIKDTIDNWYKNGVTVGGIKASEYQATYQGETWKCGDLWDYIKDSLLPSYHDKAGKYLSRLDSRDLELITGTKNIPKSDFDEIAIQAGIVNSVLDNKDLPLGVTYAGGKTQAEFVQQNLGAGYYMSKMLPIMQSLFRALIYALLPAIIAISLLPGGWTILKNYAKTAVWVELWGVIAAVLNFFILKYTEHNISGDITVYSASNMLSETSAMAGMAGYLYLMVPAIAWGIMSGSFTMLQGLGSGVAAGLSKNMQTTTTAQDSQKMKMKEAMSQKLEKDLSYAEALHYQNNIKGIEEGVGTAVKVQKGIPTVKELADLNGQKPFADFQKKKEFLKQLGYAGTAGSVANSEAKVSAGGLTKSLGDLDETGGTKNMYNRGRMGASSDMGKLDTIGVKGAYDTSAGAAAKSLGEFKQVGGTKKMFEVGRMSGAEQRGKLDTIGIGGAYKVSAGNASKSLGEVEVAGVSGMHGAGRKQGREDIAAARIEKKHGAAVTEASFNKSNEDILRTNERINTLKNEGLNVDSFLITDTKQNVKTQEIPNYLRNDRDGNGVVSDKEIEFEQNVNSLEAKKAIVDKFSSQEQLAKNAEQNRNSKSKTVRDAQSNGESIVAGLDDRSKAVIGASATKATVGAKVENANQRKDSRVLEQLNDNGKDMEDTAILDSKRMVGDLAQLNVQTDTTAQLIKDNIAHSQADIKEKITDSLKDRKNLDYNQKTEIADKTLMSSMARVGIADADLTQRNLSRDIKKIETETQSKLKAGLLKHVSSEDLQVLDTYAQLQQGLEIQKQKGNQAGIKAWSDTIAHFEKSHNMQEIQQKIEAYHNLSEAQSIIQEGQQKLEQTYNSYEQMGLIKRDGGQIKVADTARTIETLNGEQKALYVEKVKRSLDGLKTSTVGIDGMQLERVDDILGGHTTERATATQEWSKTGKFNYDIQYYAVKQDWVDREHVAKFNTGVHTMKSMLSLYGFSKVVSK